jgi:hypothetical protein
MITILFSLLSWATAREIPSDFVMKHLTSLNTLKVERSLITSRPQKNIYFQNKKIVQGKDIIKNLPYCMLENVRDEVEKISLEAKTTFSFDNHDFMRSDSVISLRIWHNHWFWGKNNGDVQELFCDGNPDFLNNDLEVILRYSDFKKIVGNYLTIH